MSSRIIAKKTFYSGELTLTVHLLEGHHESPAHRQKQVHGCKHNVVYRISIKPKAMRGADSVVQWVCPPAHLERGVDSLSEMKSSAHAALSFAADEGFAVEEHAATTHTGWHIGSTSTNAWPGGERRARASKRDPAKKRRRTHAKVTEYPSKHGKRDAGTLWVIWGPVSNAWGIFQGPNPFTPSGARQIGIEQTWEEADRFAKQFFSPRDPARSSHPRIAPQLPGGTWSVGYPSVRGPGKVTRFSSKRAAMNAAQAYSAKHPNAGYVDVMRNGITVADFIGGKGAAGKGRER